VKLELAKLEAKKQHLKDIPENNHSQTEIAPPHAQLVQMAHAHSVSQIVYVAAKLSLADHLANGPKSADELAGNRDPRTLPLPPHADACEPRYLAEDVPHCFALTPLGDALRLAHQARRLPQS
jgi:hypothetical protein